MSNFLCFELQTQFCVYNCYFLAKQWCKQIQSMFQIELLKYTEESKPSIGTCGPVSIVRRKDGIKSALKKHYYCQQWNWNSLVSNGHMCSCFVPSQKVFFWKATASVAALEKRPLSLLPSNQFCEISQNLRI